jgi:DNA-binding response OmpR family regulator/two-component sensor histidine kinase
VKVWRRRKDRRQAKTPASAETDLDNARVEFLANIVHEIRTPLTVIQGQIDAALIEADDKKRQRQLRAASRNARRLERLANQVHDLTQLSAGSLPARLRKVELLPFVESLVMSFEDLADRKGLLLEFYAKRGSIRGRVDPDHLTTIISNLMSNAVSFTPAGGRIGVALDFAAPNLMQLAVVDTGVGIAKERQEHIFDTFARHSGAGPTGAGIGLALARELARLHDGDITLQSQPGKGCRFDVAIPVGTEIVDDDSHLLTAAVDRPEVTSEILYRSTVQSAPQNDRPGQPSVLLIDANDEFRQWAAEVLADVASVDSEKSVDVALRLASELAPDLIIVDDHPPGSDAVEFTRRIRGDERTSHVAVALISARRDSDRRIEALDAGADEYLEKPIAGRELCARATNIFDRHRKLRERFREQIVIRPADISERSVDQRFLEKVKSTIENCFEIAEFSVQDLGDAVGMSTSQLSRKLRALIDQSPAQLVRRMRLQRAADLIAANAGQISDICFRVGFSDQSHFSRTFKRQFGVSPMDYRRQHEGADRG